MSTWTAEDVRRHNARLAAPSKRAKYGSTKTVVDGITFDSKKEAQHYAELKLRERAKQISGLERQPAFEIYVTRGDNGTQVHIGWYHADFEFWENGVRIIEDVKSTATRTEAYRLRKKLVEAIYGFTITEVV